ncbi:MAG: NUDIX hydrolase [Eubacteriales bacterium]|jgi:8-oxo-dGTP pyrophosphatase MutT (NUDIX family)
MEYWDIYDVNKRRTGRTMLRNDWHMKPGDYHLSVLGIVTDGKGRFLITQRKADKEWAPLAWEVSGGGVRAGEDSREAVIREVTEETGLCLDRAAVSLVSSYRNDSPAEKNNYFVDIYEIRLDFSDEDVHPQEDETEGFRIAGIEEIRELGEAGQFLHYERLMPILEKIVSA